MSLHETSLTPEGYHSGYRFRYPRNFVYVGKGLPFLAALILYFLVARGEIGKEIQGLVGILIWFFLVTFLLLDTIRGLIQRGACRLLGYRISFLTLLLTHLNAIFAADPGQFQSRRDALLVAISPLGVFLILLLSLFFVRTGIIVEVFALFVLVNLAGTVWDLYFFWKLLRMPRKTLLYAESIITFLVFEPESNKG